ncbi:hypothetical protein JNUCC64_05315 [Streptomyces sp. JNUCC 64]
MSAGNGRGPSVSDGEWERFLAESVDGVPDAPEEPSARVRAVARRLRENPGPPPPWRAPAPPRPKRRKGWYAAGVLAALALAVVAVDPDRVVGWFDGGSDTADAKTSTTTPTGPRPTLEEPFRGSPAERWASGAAGIPLPPAKATGWMDERRVERALGRSRDFLAAANLDPVVLRGERPARAVALVNPRQRDVRGLLTTAFDAPDGKNDPLLLFTRFDRERARLVGDEVRTRGRVTFREGEHGALRVTADVTFVYPVTPADGGGEVVRTVVRREVVMDWHDPAKVDTEPGTFSLVSYAVHTTNGGCGPTTGFLTPAFGTERPRSGGGPGIDPYDREAPVRTGDGRSEEQCETATRS